MYDTDLVKRPFRAISERSRTKRADADGLPPTPRGGFAEMPADVELAVFTAIFDAREGSEGDLLAALARYVVMTRNEPLCRNVDLVASTTHRGRFLVIEKWDNADAVQEHLNSPLMTDMAHEVLPALVAKPSLDLYDTISAHDLM
jgi:quinol monooxygenase YgiN